MASSLILSPQFLPRTLYGISSSYRPIFLFLLNFNRNPLPPLQASRPISSNFPQKGDNFVGDPRDWKRNLDFYGVKMKLMMRMMKRRRRKIEVWIKFVQNVLKKISRKARKAVRSVLPINISTKLVGFSVNGVIILAGIFVDSEGVS